MSKHKIGERVHLNDTGLLALYNRVNGMQHMKTLETVVVCIDLEVATDEGPAYIIEVDSPELNTDTILFDFFFDKVTL